VVEVVAGDAIRMKLPQADRVDSGSMAMAAR
jgi:hypothetical protein